MTARVTMLLALIAAAGACSPIVSQTRAKANSFAEQGQLREAEEEVGRAMDTVLTQREYDALLVERCAFRIAVARQEVDALVATGATTLADVERLQQYVRRCPDFGEIDLVLTNLGIELAEDDLRARADPLIPHDRYGALAITTESTRFLPESHPRAAWVEEHRAALAQPYARGHAAHAGSHPLTAAVFARLHNNTRTTPAIAEELEQLAHQQLMVRRRSAVGGTMASGCEKFVTRTPHVEAGVDGLAYDVVAMQVQDCRVQVAIEDSEETYEVPKQVKQLVTETVKVTKPVTTVETTHHYSCSTDLQGNNRGCRYSHKTSSASTKHETRYETQQVERLVTVMEKRTRPVRRATVSTTAVVTGRIVGFGAETEFSTSASVVQYARNFDLDTPHAEIEGQLEPPQRTDTLAHRIDIEAMKASDGAARRLRMRQLARQSDEALASGDDATAREIALIRWVGGADLTAPERTLIDTGFGVPIADGSPDGLPAVAAFQWLRPVARANVFRQVSASTYFEGVIVHGYPWTMSTIGPSVRQPERLAAQPARVAVDLAYDGNMRYSLMNQPYHRGLGLMVGVDWGLSIGRRFGENYASPLNVSEKDERRITLGMRLCAPVMLGFRTYFLAMFAGAKPSYTNFSIGDFFSEGPALPLAARLEFRPLERYPFIVEGWFGHLGKSGRAQHGATLAVPVRTPTDDYAGIWIQARFDHFTLPARIPGLLREDRVFVAGATTTSGSIGVTLGY